MVLVACLHPETWQESWKMLAFAINVSEMRRRFRLSEVLRCESRSAAGVGAGWGKGDLQPKALVHLHESNQPGPKLHNDQDILDLSTWSLKRQDLQGAANRHDEDCRASCQRLSDC